MNNFGKRLKKLREAKGIDVKELAKIVGCHFLMLLDWENGNRCLTVGTLIRLSKYLGVSIDYLVGM